MSGKSFLPRNIETIGMMYAIKLLLECTILADLLLEDETELVEYRMDSVTSGLDAQAVVTLVIETKGGQKVLGRSGDTNIVTASINAFLNALGKIYKNDL